MVNDQARIGGLTDSGTAPRPRAVQPPGTAQRGSSKQNVTPGITRQNPVSLRMGLAIVSSREKLGVESAVVIRAATRAIIDFFAIDMAPPVECG